MTLCDSIDTLAMTYLDDELADEELRDFELHLIGCAACRGRVDGERDEIAELRRRLAPPPTPDVVRARLVAALDREDSVTGGRAWAQWLLPGAATLAAAAALIMFVTMRDPAPERPKASQVMAERVRAPQPVVQGGATRTAGVAYRVATWDEVVLRHDITKVLYEVSLSAGRRVSVLASVFSTRDWDLHVGKRVVSNGFELWATTQNGESQVFYEGPTGTGYAFAAPELSLRDLVDLAASTLIDDLGGR
jgi:anti-sigma factor RsiW